jgi:hypothetical protein
MDDVTAEELGKHVGALAVNVSEDARPIQIALLACHRGPLQIGGLKTIDQARARVLAARQSPDGIRGLAGLFISDVATITPDVAAILATYEAGELALCGLTSLTEDVARELVKHPLLALDCVKRVSDRIAKILAGHTGASLSLRGLVEASPAALAALRANPAIHLRPT